MPTPFEAAYTKLNPLQKQAVDTIDGPLMVIAGPGTGKTQVLTIRIANILKQTDSSPQSILALTFTESGAHTMRRRLIEFIGTDAYRVRIETFHAFCDDVIRNHPEYFPIQVNSQPLSDIEKFQFFEHLLHTLPLTHLRTLNSPFHYLKLLMKTISDLKREGITVERFKELVAEELEVFEQEKSALKKTALTKREKELAKMSEIALVFEKYQELLTERRRYDYDDMICFVVDAFQSSADLLAEYQERFLYILVDEYQDTNAAQNKVVDLLASYWGEDANLCVVGDPHQSIYRFQGASLENTMGFIHRYPTSQVITLQQGYRCPQPIYDAAAAVIQHNPKLEDAVQLGEVQPDTVHLLSEGLAQPLISQKAKSGPTIHVTPVASVQHEQLCLVQRVRALLDKGVNPAQIAVLYRNNADGVELQEVFAKYNVPVSVDHKQDALQNTHIQQLLLLLKSIAAIKNGSEGPSVAELLFAPWISLERLMVMKLLRSAGKTNMSVYERVQLGYPELVKLQETRDVTALDFETFQSFFERLAVWASEETQTPFCYWLEQVLQGSGFLEWATQQPDRLILLEHVNSVLKFVRQLADADSTLHLEEFLDIVATMQEHQLVIPVDLSVLKDQGVTFSTTHKAKGQEWDYVFLIHCIDGKWGNSKGSRSLPLPTGVLSFDTKAAATELDDDRRLFYVALTRASKEFWVSYPETVLSGQNEKSSLGSLFIEEIPSELKTAHTFEVKEEQMLQFLQTVLPPAPLTDWSEREQQWLKELTADLPLSVSALNAYLHDPQEFFKRYILKVPQAPDARLAYGTAMHAALETVYRSWLEAKQIPAESDVLEHFQRVLRQHQLPQSEYVARLERGYEVLRSYLQRPITESQPIFLEKFFGYGVNTTMLEDVRLTGRIDRADWIDQSMRTVRVVDYKTGRSKTINEIDGKVGTTEYSERELNLPEGIRGAFKRQLLFYKLLLQLDKTFSGTVSSGVFEFVEPDRDGKFVTRELPLFDEDVELLKSLILEVAAEIRQLKFLTSNSES
jgi:DNA helicase-2/ATP-dependent DNA helicase PcrA